MKKTSYSHLFILNIGLNCLKALIASMGMIFLWHILNYSILFSIFNRIPIKLTSAWFYLSAWLWSSTLFCLFFLSLVGLFLLLLQHVDLRLGSMEKEKTHGTHQDWALQLLPQHWMYEQYSTYIEKCPCTCPSSNTTGLQEEEEWWVVRHSVPEIMQLSLLDTPPV